MKAKNYIYQDITNLFTNFAKIHGLKIEKTKSNNLLFQENYALYLGCPGTLDPMNETPPIESLWAFQSGVKEDKLIRGQSAIQIIEIINEIVDTQNIEPIEKITDVRARSMFLFVLQNSKFFKENLVLKQICLDVAHNAFQEPSDVSLKSIYKKYVTQVINELLAEGLTQKMQEIQIMEQMEQKIEQNKKECKQEETPTSVEQKIPSLDEISQILKKNSLDIISFCEKWLEEIEKNPQEKSSVSLKNTINKYFSKEEADKIALYTEREEFWMHIRKTVFAILEDNKYPKTDFYNEEIEQAAKLLFNGGYSNSKAFIALKIIKLLQPEHKIVSSSYNILFQLKLAEVGSILEKYGSNLKDLYLTFLSSDKNAKWTIDSIQNYKKEETPNNISQPEKESDRDILLNFLNISKNIENKNIEIEWFKSSLKEVLKEVLLSNYLNKVRDFKDEFKKCLQDSYAEMIHGTYIASYPPKAGKAFAVMDYLKLENPLYLDLGIEPLIYEYCIHLENSAKQL